MPVQPPITSTLGFTRAAVLDDRGMVTRDFYQWLAKIEAKTNTALTILGDLDPNIEVETTAGTLGALLQNLDANGVMESLGVDFSRGYTAKNLANVPDGSGRFAVVNAAGQNGVNQVNGSNQTVTATYAPNSVSAQIQSSVTIAVGIDTTLKLMSSLTASTNGGAVALLCSAILYDTDAAAHEIAIKVYKGDSSGTLLYDTGVGGVHIISGFHGQPWSVPLLDSSPAASQQYTIYAQADAGAGIVAQMDQIYMLTINLKA